jgi:hypothetical protein
MLLKDNVQMLHKAKRCANMGKHTLWAKRKMTSLQGVRASRYGWHCSMKHEGIMTELVKSCTQVHMVYLIKIFGITCINDNQVA